MSINQTKKKLCHQTIPIYVCAVYLNTNIIIIIITRVISLYLANLVAHTHTQIGLTRLSSSSSSSSREYSLTHIHTTKISLCLYHKCPPPQHPRTTTSQSSFLFSLPLQPFFILFYYFHFSFLGILLLNIIIVPLYCLFFYGVTFRQQQQPKRLDKDNRKHFSTSISSFSLLFFFVAWHISPVRYFCVLFKTIIEETKNWLNNKTTTTKPKTTTKKKRKNN